jgi:hypothetical protein
MKKKETDHGILEEKEGYNTLTRDEEFQEYRDMYKVPFVCPACNGIMYNIDTSAFHKFGICKDCEMSWIFERNLDSNLLRDRKKLLKHIINSIEEKNERKRKMGSK